MKRQFLYSCLAVALFMALGGSCRGDTELDESQTINGPLGKLTIYDSFNTGAQTVIDCYGTGQVFETFDSSILNLYDGASFMDDGWRDYNWLHDMSTVNLYAGAKIGFLSTNSIYLLDHSTLNVYGGRTSCLLIAEGNGTINLYSGHLGYGFAAYENSTVNIYGGTLEAWARYDQELASTATLNIYGYGFTYERDEYPGYWSFGRLSGFDLDGNPVVYDGIPDPAENPNIHFIPEPGTVLLLGLGSALIHKRYV